MFHKNGLVEFVEQIFTDWIPICHQTNKIKSLNGEI